MNIQKKFSERMGYSEPRKIIQIDSINDDLRTSLWNLLYLFFFDPFIEERDYRKDFEFGTTFVLLWMKFFKKKLNEIPDYAIDGVNFLNEFFFSCKWYEVYDFIEFILVHYSRPFALENLIDAINHTLEEEMSGYRYISGTFAPITSESELTEIESALTINSSITKHLKDALDFLSRKESPSYRNSIKESISAVETIARLITDDPNVDLGKALNKIEREGDVKIHKALKQGFSSIYGWTCDEDGVRHSLMNDSLLSVEDPTFMLVACSAFINLLRIKASKSGIQIPSEYSK